MRFLAVLALGLSACVDYGLGDRPFLCSMDDDCGEALVCGAAGVCQEPPDAGGPDATTLEMCGNGVDDDLDLLVDCNDPDCGLSSCDDVNVCTEDVCQPSGACMNGPLTVSPCPGATGCTCQAGVPRETACQDGTDNDLDGDPDCQDPDCPSICMGGFMCCSDGGCAVTCPG